MLKFLATMDKTEKEEDAQKKFLHEGQKEDRESFQVDTPLTACGLGPCRPRFLQKCASIQAFTANVFIIVVIYIASYAYLLGVMRTIEKRFGFSSVRTGVIVTVADTMTTCTTIFVGYIGDRSHKPRILSVMMFLIAVSLIFFLAGSYLYFPPSNFGQTFLENKTTEVLLCNSNYQRNETRCDEKQSENGGNNAAFLLLIFGAVLHGFGGSSCICVTFAYVDQNIKKTDSSVYVGKRHFLFNCGFLLKTSIFFAFAVS